MTTKKAGKPNALDSFGTRAAVLEPSSNGASAKPETKPITLTVTKADWRRLHDLTKTHDETFQSLLTRALSKELKAMGLPSLEPTK